LFLLSKEQKMNPISTVSFNCFSFLFPKFLSVLLLL